MAREDYAPGLKYLDLGVKTSIRSLNIITLYLAVLANAIADLPDDFTGKPRYSAVSKTTKGLPAITKAADVHKPFGNHFEKHESRLAKRQFSNETHFTVTPNTTSSATSTSTYSVGAFLCPPALPSNDPISFVKSGAVEFLDDFLGAHSPPGAHGAIPDNWLNVMDSNTTNDGNFQSALDCRELGGETCPIPTEDCKTFTPPAVWWIRVAATQAHDFFTRAHETLQDATILDALQIDQIVNDFTIPQPDPNSLGNQGIIADVLKALSPVFSMGDKVIKQESGFGPTADALGFIGGAVNEAAADITLADPSGAAGEALDNLGDMTRAAERTLANAFNKTNINIANANRVLFGDSTGDSNAFQAIIRGAATAGATIDPNLFSQTALFATGFFTVDPDSAQASLKNGLLAGINLLQQQLVGAVLAAQHVVVFQNLNGNQQGCDAVSSNGKFLDNTCFTMAQAHILAGNGKSDSSDLSADIMNKLQGPPYNINLESLYRNVQACNNAKTPNTGITFDGDFPSCAFGLPFMSAKDRICNVASRGPFDRSFQFDRCFNAPDTTFTEDGGFETPSPGENCIVSGC
ncbi:hypothetical protein NA57DRAFT_79308 [Rhizodiscina lignyota]|uniref:Uncharacterized protein n=1 Tax=Rhizodiscina lignyota TaxID=1504668 RepID=A0A9P4M3D4_9PEZI|nr:hypothetical protein NA57DRAFT_79308 [Rhizodiscina lignyota]